MMLTFRVARLAVLGAALILFPKATARADIAYALTGAGGGSSSIFQVNPRTGATVAGTMNTITIGGTGVMVSAVAYNAVDGLIYGAAVDPVSLRANLVTIDLSTGVATGIGTFLPTISNVNPTSLAFASNGTLYAYFKNISPSESLFTVNTSSGLASLVGPSGLPSTSGNGMAIRPDGTKLYFTPDGASAASSLYAINPTNGAATQLTNLSGAPIPTGQIKGLVFDSTGVLYGVNFRNGSPFNANLITIDPVTGAITNIGDMTARTSSLVFVPSSTAVPEPRSICLMGLAAMFGGLRLRQRLNSSRGT